MPSTFPAFIISGSRTSSIFRKASLPGQNKRWRKWDIRSRRPAVWLAWRRSSLITAFSKAALSPARTAKWPVISSHVPSMHKILSSHLFVNHRLTTVWLERVRDAGFDHIEIFCARQHLDYRNGAQVKELSHWFNASGLKVWSLHAPMYNDEVWGRSGPQSIINIAETSKVKRIAMVDEIKRALEAADLIPFRHLIQHIGV